MVHMTTCTCMYMYRMLCTHTLLLHAGKTGRNSSQRFQSSFWPDISIAVSPFMRVILSHDVMLWSHDLPRAVILSSHEEGA